MKKGQQPSKDDDTENQNHLLYENMFVFLVSSMLRIFTILL